MDKEVFAKRIKNLRVEKGLTKEELCQDEEHLSVRQLTRLETGKSQPTLATLEYLSEAFGVSVAYLLGKEEVSLPQEYQNLKYQFIRTSSYSNPEVWTEMEELLDKLLEFYEDLPAEEQLAVDILQSQLYTFTSQGEKFGLSLLEEYLPHLLEKREYTLNDLLLIQLYGLHIEAEDSIKETFDIELLRSITKKLLEAYETTSEDYLFLLRDLLIIPLYVESLRKEFRYSSQALTMLREIMEETQDFQKKPILLMLEWKYALFAQKDRDAAVGLYRDAKTLAQLFGNPFLVGKLEEEWEQDTGIRSQD
ncbi:helix-turn-helix domain-containing protein [Streptococcus himalayensis]|uniref:helix-turn-helix domain-containing protein n=2 Tax=Streptococcus himalayensis TaxID=1888195 RepID=UPI00083CE6E3|nr:XRE family transcriptional regulator [Streptococcus himalayensis]